MPTADAVADWLARDRARVAAIPAHHAALLAGERAFFRRVARAVLGPMPEAVELRLFGSRASLQHRRGSDWDFLAVAEALDPGRRSELGTLGRGGLADLDRVGGRRVDVEARDRAGVGPGRGAFADGMLEHALVVWSLAADGLP